jgi:hypothetical protein
MNHDHDLTRDLAVLGRSVETPASGGLRTAVLDRVAALATPEPSRTRRWRERALEVARTWRRAITLFVVAVLVGLAATPPVRAAVADWFDFGGVVVEQGPDLGDDAPPPPPAEGTMSVARAEELVGFTPLVPAALGAPEAVEVSDDRVMVAMSWSTEVGPIRLDQFDGTLDWRIAKTSPGVTYASVTGVDALWFERPHRVVVLDEDGQPRTESARLAGHTLIWPVGHLTLRLEGDLSLERAVEIAESAGPYAG